MSTEQFDYNATLNRMAGLDELTQYIAATSTASVANKRQLLSQIKKMADDISKVRDQIDAIKNKGAQANASIITVIKSANDKQKQSLTSIKNSIKELSNVDQLQTNISTLEKDIENLTAKALGSSGPGPAPESKPASTLNASAKPFTPGAASAPTSAPAPAPASGDGPMIPDAADPANPANKKGGYKKSRKMHKRKKHHTKKNKRNGRR
jgi:outer membrane murein-binding lipoprotein Lpp